MRTVFTVVRLARGRDYPIKLDLFSLRTILNLVTVARSSGNLLVPPACRPPKVRA